MNAPVIIHQLLERSQYEQILSKQFRVRVSDSIITNSVIFPVSGVAFIVLSLRAPVQWADQLDEDLKTNLERFMQIHRHCYVLVQTSLHGNEDTQTFSTLQNSYLHTKLQLLPVYSPMDGVKAMCDIAKLLCKPVAPVMNQRFEAILKSQMTDGVFESILHQIGLDQHQIRVLQDGVGSLSQLVRATKEDLVDCSLDTETANNVFTSLGMES